MAGLTDGLMANDDNVVNNGSNGSNDDNDGSAQRAWVTLYIHAHMYTCILAHIQLHLQRCDLPMHW